MKKTLLSTFPVLLLATAFLFAEEKKHEHPVAAPGTFTRTASPEGAKCYIIGLKDGAKVPRTFTVRFGLKGMGVAPAAIDLPNTGHHHLLVDAKGELDTALPIPADETHLHFGAGQTETELTLEPGTHTLQLVLGDKLHVPHDPPVMSKKITITVE